MIASRLVLVSILLFLIGCSSSLPVEDQQPQAEDSNATPIPNVTSPSDSKETNNQPEPSEDHSKVTSTESATSNTKDGQEGLQDESPLLRISEADFSSVAKVALDQNSFPTQGDAVRAIVPAFPQFGIKETAYSPTGDEIVITTNSSVYLYDLVEGRCINVLWEKKHRIEGLQWSPNGEMIALNAYGDRKNRVHVYQVFPDDSVKLIQIIADASLPRWSNDGKRLFVNRGVRNEKVDIVEIGQEPTPLIASSELIADYAVVPNSESLLLAHRNGVISIWNTKGEELGVHKEHPSYMKRILVSQNGELALTFDGKKIVIWQADNEDKTKWKAARNWEPPRGLRTPGLFRVGDGFRIVVSVVRKPATVYDEHFAEVTTLSPTLGTLMVGDWNPVHQSEVAAVSSYSTSNETAFALADVKRDEVKQIIGPDQRILHSRVVSIGPSSAVEKGLMCNFDDGETFKVSPQGDPKLMVELDATERIIASTSQGEWISFHTQTQSVKYWSSDGTQQQTFRLPLQLFDKAPRASVASRFHPRFSNDGRYYAFAEREARAPLQNTDVTLHWIDRETDKKKSQSMKLDKRSNRRIHYSVSPTGTVAYSESYSNGVSIWDANSEDEPEVISSSRGHVLDLKWSHNGEFLLIARRGSSLLWNSNSKKISMLPRLMTSSEGHYAWSPDDGRILLYSEDRALRIFSMDPSSSVLEYDFAIGGRPSVLPSSVLGTAVWVGDNSLALWRTDGGLVVMEIQDERLVQKWTTYRTGIDQFVTVAHDGTVVHGNQSSVGRFYLSAKTQDETFYLRPLGIGSAATN